MTRILLVLAMLAALSVSGLAAADTPVVPLPANEQSIPVPLCRPMSGEAVGASDEQVAADPERRGCCSWHGGVCGCSADGRAVCCDRSLSPSCGC